MAGVPPYGPAIHQAIAKGDLDDMRRLAIAAEQHIVKHGNIPLALEVLRVEIAKLESRSSE